MLTTQERELSIKNTLSIIHRTTYQTRKAKNTNNWFVGGITGENARTSTFVLDFLEPGKQYVATLYADGKDADYEKNPTSYQIKKGLVTYKTKISTDLARSGGFAISLIEATPADKKELKKWK